MELRFEKVFDRGFVAWKLKLRKEDIREFEEIFKRFDALYYDSARELYNLLEPIGIIRRNEDTYLITHSDIVEPFDVEKNVIDDLVNKLKEAKEELNDKETLIYEI